MGILTPSKSMGTINYFRLRLKKLRGALADLGPLLPLIVVLVLVAGLGMTFTHGCDGKGSTTATPLGQVTIPDSNLEASVREALNISRRPIYMSDLKLLTSLYAPERSISDLTGLKYCVNLKVLSLEQNNISDISALVANSGLSAEDIVGLQNNPLSTISRNVYIPQLEVRGVIYAPLRCGT